MQLGSVGSEEDLGIFGLGGYLETVKLNGVLKVDLITCELYEWASSCTNESKSD